MTEPLPDLDLADVTLEDIERAAIDVPETAPDPLDLPVRDLDENSKL
jgi:hypothetical protein